MFFFRLKKIQEKKKKNKIEKEEALRIYQLENNRDGGGKEGGQFVFFIVFF